MIPRTERGVALLETLVALAILSGAGIALLSLIATGLRAEWEAGEHERILAVEERVLTVLTLLKRDELDRRIGRHQIGELVFDIERPEPTLYRIAVLQASSPQTEDLVTVVYRRQLINAP